MTHIIFAGAFGIIVSLGLVVRALKEIGRELKRRNDERY